MKHQTMTDIEIANSVEIQPIVKIAKKAGIDPEIMDQYGKYKAKLPLSLIDPTKVQEKHLILVSAISPTPAGEGKTTVSIGLADGLNRIGKKTTVVLREPSLGPVFGIKGGATGGGYSQVIPMEDINLHFTGDFNAVEKAHNLLAALIDNNIQSKNSFLGLDPRTVTWKRVIDMNDRSLRHIVQGLGGTTSGVPRESGFDITAASEIMAILCLAESITDLKERLGNIFVGYTFSKKPIYARDLKANGAMAALLKEAIKPNLVQTLEGNPAIIHGGPFANIAQGTNSILATKMGLSISDFVVTEAGFGFDLGAEKFFDIKCVKALKYHGGVKLENLKEENIDALRSGLENLEKHVENMIKFNVCPVIALNKFITDTEAEIQVIKDKCDELGVPIEVSDGWSKGSEGTKKLAILTAKVAEQCVCKLRPLYDWDWSVEKKIETIAKEVYGAAAIDYTAKAKNDLKRIATLGLEHLPICMAKTQKSLSDNPKLLGRPKDFIVTVRQIEIASGAGFLIPITGEIMRMPGLPEKPASENIDIDENGHISGLF